MNSVWSRTKGAAIQQTSTGSKETYTEQFLDRGDLLSTTEMKPLEVVQRLYIIYAETIGQR